MKNQLLIRFEWRKLLSKTTLLLLVLLVIGKVLLLWFTTAPDSNDQLYEKLIGQVQGELTVSSRQWIEEQKEHRDYVLSMYEQMRTDYAEGTISYETFREYDREFQTISKEETAFKQLYQKYQYFLAKESQYLELTESPKVESGFQKTRNDITLEQYTKPFLLFYDTGWSKLIGEGDIDFLLLIFLMIVCIPYMLKEHECGITDIVGVSAKRNTLYLFKTVHILLFGLVCSLLTQGINLFFIMARYALPYSHAPLQSLEQYSAYPHSISVLSTAVVSSMIQICSVLVLLLFACAVCLLLKKIISSLLVYILVVFFPVVGQLTLPAWLTGFLFPHILSGSRIFAYYALYNVGGFPLSNVLLIILFYVILSALSVVVLWKQCNRLKS